MARRTHKYLDSSAIAIATEVAALPYPPVNYAVMTGEWVIANDHTRAVPEMRVAIWANASTNLTDAEMFAGILHALPSLVVADDVDTVDFANNELDITGHLYKNGDGPFQLTTSDTLPTGLSLATDYYVISNATLGVNTIKLATSRALALAGTAVTFSDVGVGTHTVTAEADATRMFWHTMGLLGNAKDGAITLTADRAYVVTADTIPNALCYGIYAVLSDATPELVSAAIYPVSDA